MVDVTPIGAKVDLLARVQQPTTSVHELLGRGHRPKTFYAGELRNINGAFTASILFDNNGVITALASKTVGTGQGTLHFQVVNSSLKLFLNSTLVAFADNATIANPGGILLNKSGGATVTTFNANSITTLTPTLPFTTDFSSTSYGSQLDLNWTDQNGNVTVMTGQPTGEAPGNANLSTLNGITQADVKVTANVTMSSGQIAGLVARYTGQNGSLESNLYLGQLYDSGSGVQATIWKNVGGVYTMLIIGQTANKTSGTFEFDVIGSSLKVLFNGQLLASITDTSLTAAGSVGIRLRQNVAMTNFHIEVVPHTKSVLASSDGLQLNLEGFGKQPTTSNANPPLLNNSNQVGGLIAASMTPTSTQGATWGAGHDGYLQNNLPAPVIDADWTAEL